MNYVRRTLRLYLTNRTWALGIPVFILGGMVALSILISVIIGINLGFPLPADVQDGMRGNAGSVYSIPGFLIALGALAMNRNFSMALAFGASRRNFYLGTSLGFLATAATVGVGALVGLAVERLTNYWFIGARAFDVTVLGDGNIVKTFMTMFVLALLSMYVGALFGTIFRAFGTVWTSVSVIAVVLVLAALLILTVWQWRHIEPLYTRLGDWLPLILAAVAAVLAAAGSYGVNRRATV